ncbi:MAG TPA: hypothetical protein VM347_34575 [Nonomuraea sp.]|nr:hypothetical protein [Nonomuraea sp.]
MTEFAHTDENEPQATPGTEGAIAPAPQQPELTIGVGTLLGRLSAGEAA